MTCFFTQLRFYPFISFNFFSLLFFILYFFYSSAFLFFFFFFVQNLSLFLSLSLPLSLSLLRPKEEELRRGLSRGFQTPKISLGFSWFVAELSEEEEEREFGRERVRVRRSWARGGRGREPTEETRTPRVAVETDREANAGKGREPTEESEFHRNWVRKIKPENGFLD